VACQGSGKGLHDRAVAALISFAARITAPRRMKRLRRMRAPAEYFPIVNRRIIAAVKVLICAAANEIYCRTVNN